VFTHKHFGKLLLRSRFLTLHSSRLLIMMRELLFIWCGDHLAVVRRNEWMTGVKVGSRLEVAVKTNISSCQKESCNCKIGNRLKEMLKILRTKICWFAGRNVSARTIHHISYCHQNAKNGRKKQKKRKERKKETHSGTKARRPFFFTGDILLCYIILQNSRNTYYHHAIINY
jgi:hypothetical protein